MINVVIFAALLYGGLTGVLYLAQRHIMYYPDTATPRPERYGLADMRAVTLETGDGLSLLAWYRRAGEGRPSLVYFTGNAGHIGDRAFKVRPYLDAGLGVLLVGYRGYGGNPGRPTERGLYADGRAALAFLEGEGVAPARIVLYGESLGSGVAVELAAERAVSAPLGALVLEAPFTSIADAAATHYPVFPVRWLVKDRFDNKAKIARIEAPLLIVHGENDRVVPLRLGKELFAAAAEPKEGRWFKGLGHNDLYSADVPAAVLDFLARRLSPPSR